MSRNLYKRLFLNRSSTEILQLLSDGIMTFVTNAERLYEDAQLLFREGRWASGRFLLAVADEEMAKPYIVLDACRLDFSRHQSSLVQLCDAFYDHTYKYAYNNILNNPNIQNLFDGRNAWLESIERWTPYSEAEDVEPIHETYFLLEMPLYIDFLDYDKRWSTPREDVAEYNYSMGGGILGSKSALEILKKTQKSGLFSPPVLNLVNENFKEYYFSDVTTDNILVDLHEKTAKEIETKLGISVTTYNESILHTIPLYHFLTI